MDLLTYKNIKRAGKAVKYGVAFANAYKDMSQELPINNMLPEFMTNSVFSKTMGATLKTINAMNSANDKRNCFLNGIKENLERGDVSQFEMLMRSMQAYAQRENNAAMNAMIQRMYHDIYGEGGMASGYNAPVNDSLRSMDNCSISPQPHANASMLLHHHHHHTDHNASMQSFSSVPTFTPPVYPGPPVTHTNCTSNPVVPSAPYRNDAISTTPYSSQAYSTTSQSGYRLPHQNYSNHAMAPRTAPHASHSIHTAHTVPYNHSAAYSTPLNNHSMPKAIHTTHQQSNYRGYPVSKPPHANYSVPLVSTMPGSTVITIPAAGPHNNYGAPAASNYSTAHQLHHLPTTQQY